MGMGRYGGGLAEYLLRRKYSLLGVDFDPNILEKWNKKGVPVLYSDLADPEIHEQLPLKTAKWVISSVRSKEMNLALVDNLKRHGYTGKIALTATNEKEVNELKTAGAHLVFSPFKDATEQAADALAGVMDFLPEDIGWPISFIEVRLRSDSAAAGKDLKELPISETGVTVLAVSRGGRTIYEPAFDFRIFPGDRLLLMGGPSDLKDVENILNHHEPKEAATDEDRFIIGELRVGAQSDLSGKSIAELNFRQRFGVTLVGIRRGKEEITSINPAEILHADDRLIVIGKGSTLNTLKGNKFL